MMLYRLLRAWRRFASVWVVFLIAAAWVSGSAGLADATGASPDQEISSLETKFFDTTYPKDPEDQRLERLEKLIFGEARTGTDNQRLSDLMSAVPAGSPSAGMGTTTLSPAAAAAPAVAPNYQQTAPPPTAPSYTAASPPLDSDSPGSVPSADYYPAVTALENEILGKNYRNEPVQKRLEQLESKAFGQPSTVNDLSERVANLRRYAEQRHLAPAPADETAAYPNSNIQSGAAPPAEAPLESKVAWLEQQTLGATYPNMSLLDRVRQLEVRILPSEANNSNEQLGTQVDTLISALQLSRGTPVASTAAQSEYQTPYSGYSSRPPVAGYAQSQSQYSAAPEETSPPAAYVNSQYSPPPEYRPDPQYSTASAYTPAGQYAPPAQYTPQSQYSQPAQYTSQQNPAATEQSQHPAKQHSLLGGLAKVLGTVGSMALGGGLPGIGGIGGYGGGYGMPYSYGGGYGYGGVPGIHF